MLLSDVSSQQATAGSTIFYLHTAYYSDVPGGRILSTDPPYGIQRWTSLSESISFTLHPLPGRPFRIGGTVTFRLWLRATGSAVTIVNATLVEITDTGRTLHVCGIEAPVLVEPDLKDQPFVFAVGPIARTIAAESSLVLQVLVKNAKFPVFLYWDDRRTPSQLEIPFVGKYYFAMGVTAIDLLGREMKGANITITQRGSKVWTGTTDDKGFVAASLPSTEGVGPYDVRVYWKNSVVNETTDVTLTTDLQLSLRCEVHDLTVVVHDLFGLPLAQAKVDLETERTIIASDRTSPDGVLVFYQIPKGTYALVYTYDSSLLLRQSIVLSQPARYTVSLRVIPIWFYYGATALLLATAVSITVVSRYRRRPRPVPFEFLRDLLGGEIPSEAAVMIRGNPGSGKTVLMQRLMYDQLSKGGSCVFITNNDFPEKISKDMKRLGLDVSPFRGKQLAFIDCYSGTAGRASSERYSVEVLTDLTGLGIQISSAASALGEGTTFFFDSLAPLFASLKPDPIMTFVHSIGARIKGQRGSLYFSVGTGLDNDTMSRLEGLSDCIIELETFEREGAACRRLRVKKIRGRKHSEKWVEFHVGAPEGIVFYSR